MTNRQQRFVIEYLKDCNATQAAIRAGYSTKGANVQGAELLANINIKSEIERQMSEIKSKDIADAEEILKYLTSVVRGKSTSEVVVVEGTGEGCSQARTMEKAPDEKDKLKAAELLGKRYQLFTDRMDVTGASTVIFSNEDNIPD